MDEKPDTEQIIHDALTLADDVEIGEQTWPDDIVKSLRDMASLVEVSRRDYEIMYRLYQELFDYFPKPIGGFNHES